MCWIHCFHGNILINHYYQYRDAVECDLTFCGLLVLENKLKPQTFSTIQELQMASIRTVMITGKINLL